MSSTTKTLELLNFFEEKRPEIGLSDLCRLAKRDKATTHRHLQDLEKCGFVEQNPETRNYRLGPGILELAQRREITVPRVSGAKLALRKLADATGETAHVSVLSGSSVHALDSYESPKHSIRVIIDVAIFPLHATASGLCALAFGPSNLIDAACEKMDQFTERTALSRDALEAIATRTRESGFACADRTFENEVYSLAVPLFDQSGSFAGALALASVASRLTDDAGRNIKLNLIKAGQEVSRNWGGKIPATLEAIWAEVLQNPDVLEPIL